MRGWEMSHGLIHDWAQEVGTELEQKVVEVQASMFEHGVLQEVKAAPDTLWVSVDGTLVHDRDRQSMEIKAGMVRSKGGLHGFKRLSSLRRASGRRAPEYL
jgi:hypothetical protein